MFKFCPECGKKMTLDPHGCKTTVYVVAHVYDNGDQVEVFTDEVTAEQFQNSILADYAKEHGRKKITAEQLPNVCEDSSITLIPHVLDSAGGE